MENVICASETTTIHPKEVTTVRIKCFLMPTVRSITALGLTEKLEKSNCLTQKTATLSNKSTISNQNVQRTKDVTVFLIKDRSEFS